MTLSNVPTNKKGPGGKFGSTALYVAVPGILLAGPMIGFFADALRHKPSCDKYNPDFRQLLHVGYKIAAEMGKDYTSALEKYAETIARNVTENIYQRHVKPIFIA